MWTVAWELYHDFPTLRRMLLLEAEIARARAQTRETKVFITAARALQEPFHLEGPDLGCVVRSA